MSFALEAVRHNPDCLYMMDDTSPLQDYGPFNRSAVISGGTPVRGPALVKGATNSVVLTNTITAQFNTSVYEQGREDAAFSLVASVFPIRGAATSPQKILSHAANYDGLTIDGNKVSFSTKYASAGEAKCTYDLQTTRQVNLVGVHTASKNSLFVDGVLVSEVDITEAQKLDTYATTDGKLYSGTTAGTNTIAVNGIGQFRHALSPDAVRLMNTTARDLFDGPDIASVFSGSYIPMSRDASDVFIDQTWTTEEDWKLASLKNVNVVDQRLVPQFDGNTSMTGVWNDVVSLAAADTTSIYGVTFDWDGDGITIEASLDTTTWETVQRGVGLSIIPSGFNPTGKELFLRVSFPGGIVDDESYLDNLSMLGFRSAAPTSVNGRTITLTKAYPQRDEPVALLKEQWGTEILATGSIVIGTDTDGVSTARTVEVWVKATSSTQPTMTGTGVSPTIYQDGVANSGAFIIGKWTLVHVVAPATITGNITITGPAQIGHVTLYPTALSASEVEEISLAYAKTNPVVAGDTSDISMTQSAIGASVYAYDWSIVGAG